MSTRPPETDVAGNEPAARRRLPSTLVVVALALVVVTAAFAAWFGVSWWRASADGSDDLAATRDEVLQAGQTAIVTFNSLDYHDPDKAFDRWLKVSTGPAHKEVKGNLAQYKKQLTQAKVVTTAKTLDAGVSQLEAQEGKAVVLAAVEVTVRQGDQQPATKQIRLEGEMTKVGEDWKLSGIGQVDPAQPNQNKQGQPAPPGNQQGQPPAEGNGN